VTVERGFEVAGASVVAAATAAGAMVEADMSGWLVPMVSAGLAALVGYFTARITTEREMGVAVEREGNHFNEVMRRLDRIERKLDDR
jgi:hypothetical protein